MFIFFSSFSLYSVEIPQEIIGPLKEYKSKLIEAQKKVEQLQADQKNVSDQLIILNSQLASEKAASEGLRTKYDLYLDIAKADPDPDIFDMAKEVGQELTMSKNEISIIETYVTQHEKKLVHISVEMKIHKKTYDSLLDRENIHFNRAVSVIVKQQTDAFKKPKVVQGKAEEVCSRDEIIGTCEKRARVFAEKNALEKGATILVNSSTTLKNFKLEEDYIKSQLQASLSDVEIKKSAVKSLNPLSFEVIILAKVNPKLSDALLEQFTLHSTQLLEKYRFNSGLTNYQKYNLLDKSSALTPLVVVATSATKKGQELPLSTSNSPEVSAQLVSESKYKKQLTVVLSLIEQHRYFSPRRNNAYAKLGKINAPKDDSVLNVYTQLKESAIKQIDVLTNEERLADAEDLLDELVSNYTMKREANELAKNITNKKQEIKTRKVINSYLAKAKTAIRKNRFFTPRRKNAFYYYQAVLRIDSNNLSAQQALDQFPHKILQTIDVMVQEDDLGDAIDIAELALENLSSDSRISAKLDELRKLAIIKKKTQKRSISIGW